jgi:uncharacterized protein (DUF1330 family)
MGKVSTTAYVIFDVEINDPKRYQEFMAGVKAALEKAGARYLARGAPTRFMKETGSLAELSCWNSHPSPRGHFIMARPYQGLKSIRDACSSARLVAVEGVG